MKELKFKIKRDIPIPVQEKTISPEEIDNKIKGLGDLIAVVAEPIKKTIINNAPKPISGIMERCNCDKRREYLNRLMPFGNKV